MSKRVLVTGASGFVGRRLVRMLSAQGTEVVALVRRTSSTEGLRLPGVHFVKGDLADGRGLDPADLSGVGHVFHLAALTAARNPAHFYKVNVDGTRHLVEFLAESADPPGLVLCSSLAAAGPYGRPTTGARGPVSHYGRSKRAAEEIVLRSGLPAAVVRPPVLHGPGDPGFIPSLLGLARAPLVPCPSGGEQRYSLLHSDDLCHSLIAVASRGRVAPAAGAGLYEPCDGHRYTWRTIISMMCRALNRGEPRLVRVNRRVISAAAGVNEAIGQHVRGQIPLFNRDKVRELSHSWVCTETPDQVALGFQPELGLERGIVDFLTARPGALSQPGPPASHRQP